jgi:hypothetical protein
MLRSLKVGLMTAVIGAVLVIGAPAASADSVCQELAEGRTACVDTTGDPTTGSFGVRVHSAPFNLCITVFARCP